MSTQALMDSLRSTALMMIVSLLAQAAASPLLPVCMMELKVTVSTLFLIFGVLRSLLCGGMG
jgi:hypothetical protein